MIGPQPIEESPEYHFHSGREGGPFVALRAYRHWHPAARVHVIEYRGRTVWLTGKQFSMWCYIRAMVNRKQKTTLAFVALRMHCSRATVSRFLHRLDFWRFIDLLVIRGRGGGVFIGRAKRPRLGWGETRKERDLRHSVLAKAYRSIERFWKRFGMLPFVAPTLADLGYTGATFREARL